MSDGEFDQSGNDQISEATEREVTRLWRTRTTVLEMLRDRGYHVEEWESAMSLETFKAKHTANGYPDRHKLAISTGPLPEMVEKYKPLPTKDDPNPATTIGTIYVVFEKTEKPGVAQVRTFAQQLQTEGFTAGIMVTRAPLATGANKVIAAVHPIMIEAFVESELLVNITHHMLVPKHVVMSAEEKKQLLARYRLKESQLPRIQTGDPMAKYLGLRRGQVVKIIRSSQTAGRYATYRWAI